jgi:hypothetical protein
MGAYLCYAAKLVTIDEVDEKDSQPREQEDQGKVQDQDQGQVQQEAQLHGQDGRGKVPKVKISDLTVSLYTL